MGVHMKGENIYEVNKLWNIFLLSFFQSNRNKAKINQWDLMKFKAFPQWI